MPERIYVVSVDAQGAPPYIVKVYPGPTDKEARKRSILPILLRFVTEDSDSIPQRLLAFLRKRRERYVGTMRNEGTTSRYFLVSQPLRKRTTRAGLVHGFQRARKSASSTE